MPRSLISSLAAATSDRRLMSDRFEGEVAPLRPSPLSGLVLPVEEFTATARRDRSAQPEYCAQH